MLFRYPSQVSATTGSSHSAATSGRLLATHSMTPVCTAPTAWVLVIITGPSTAPVSRIQCAPVISPLPLRENTAPGTELPTPVATQRKDRGDPGARGDGGVVRVGDQRDHADLDTTDVRDRIQRPRVALQPNAEISSAHPPPPSSVGPRLAQGQPCHLFLGQIPLWRVAAAQGKPYAPLDATRRRHGTRRDR